MLLRYSIALHGYIFTELQQVLVNRLVSNLMLLKRLLSLEYGENACFLAHKSWEVVHDTAPMIERYSIP
jgi:hypothetical protein